MGTEEKEEEQSEGNCAQPWVRSCFWSLYQGPEGPEQRPRVRELCGAGPRAAGRRPLMPLCSPCLYSLLEVLALRQCGLRAGSHLYTLPGKRVSWLGELWKWRWHRTLCTLAPRALVGGWTPPEGGRGRRGGKAPAIACGRVSVLSGPGPLGAAAAWPGDDGFRRGRLAGAPDLSRAEPSQGARLTPQHRRSECGQWARGQSPWASFLVLRVTSCGFVCFSPFWRTFCKGVGLEVGNLAPQ